MIVNNNKDLIYNINTLICLPKGYNDKIKTYEYNFKYIYLFEQTEEDMRAFINFVNKNNIKQIILVSYRLEYETIIDELNEKVEIGVIFDGDLAALTQGEYLIEHNGIIKLCEEKRINKLGLLDKNLFEIANKKFENVYHIMLDEEEIKHEKNNNGIGIISNSEDPKHSFYNSLSAIRLIEKTANIINPSNDVKRFNKTFNVLHNDYNNLEEIIKNSSIILYINFCNTNTSLFLNCMDSEVPCILGNNEIINNNEILKNNLMLNSDDDINEIAKKIELVEKNKNIILEEYKKFRKEYKEKSKKSISNFLNYIEPKHEEKKYEKLLTVGIPVYNVEEYVAQSIESVLTAIEPIKDNTEIIIVNDGSTDNSEEVVLKYEQKYPNLIKYIKQENHGLGNVRNVILENSNAKYIASIDSDDTIDKEFFVQAWKYLENDVDLVLCDWLSIFKETEKYPTEAMDNILKFENEYKKLLYSTIMPSTCNKIIKKDLYKQINIKFIEGLKFEDLGTNPVILLNLETIKYINKPYYEYNIRQNSIMRTKIGYNMIDVIKILDDRLNKYVNKSFNKQEFIAYVYFWRVEESIINQLYTLEEKERKEMIEYIYSNINEILKALYEGNVYVNELIDRVDEETKNYIKERNKSMLNGELEEFLNKKINDKSYKILTPALILYNYDNRTK